MRARTHREHAPTALWEGNSLETAVFHACHTNGNVCFSRADRIMSSVLFRPLKDDLFTSVFLDVTPKGRLNSNLCFQLVPAGARKMSGDPFRVSLSERDNTRFSDSQRMKQREQNRSSVSLTDSGGADPSRKSLVNASPHARGHVFLLQAGLGPRSPRWTKPSIRS